MVHISIVFANMNPRCSMVLEYLPTKLGHKNGVNVGKCSIQHLGMNMMGDFSEIFYGVKVEATSF